MLVESPQNLLYVVGGAFFLGWMTGKISAWLSGKVQTRRRDPRDNRIRSLDAELRVARSEVQRTKDAIDSKDKELVEAVEAAAGQQKTIDEMNETMGQLRTDLKDSVQKTRELRAELSDRATENLKSEVKLREVETELSVVQASSDLMATGVLDYTVNDDEEDLSKVLTPPGG